MPGNKKRPRAAASIQPMDIDPELREDTPASEARRSSTVRPSSSPDQVPLPASPAANNIRPARVFVNIQPAPPANDISVYHVLGDDRDLLPSMYANVYQVDMPPRLQAVEAPWYPFHPRLTAEPSNYRTEGTVAERNRILPELDNVWHGMQKYGYACSIVEDPVQRQNLLDRAETLPPPLPDVKDFRDDNSQLQRPPAPVLQDPSYYQVPAPVVYPDFSPRCEVSRHGGINGQVYQNRADYQPPYDTVYPNHDRGHQVPNYGEGSSGQNSVAYAQGVNRDQGSYSAADVPLQHVQPRRSSADLQRWHQ
ncbi:hypothetical protein K456DRAFT_1730460 [Colletotrichum gloeosporioides 23]|nr:hypothetical protein K456DRAFT_1730460 [Colletotrichum gloeosporioides 23]